jgi:hypothetical protein
MDKVIKRGPRKIPGRWEIAGENQNQRWEDLVKKRTSQLPLTSPWRYLAISPSSKSFRTSLTFLVESRCEAGKEH